jgi:hypothetical protein
MSGSTASEHTGTLIARFTQVESGRNPNRPEQALHLANMPDATLVIAKLDRLSRNAAPRSTCQGRTVSQSGS